MTIPRPATAVCRNLHGDLHGIDSRGHPGGRHALDTPAKFGRLPSASETRPGLPPGMCVYCPCCGLELRPPDGIETVGRVAGHLSTDVAGKTEIRYEDDVCGYSIVVLGELRPT